MIYDKIDNWKLYAGFSEDLRLGLEYLKNVSPNVELGVHELSPRVKAIVSEYTTKEENENGYEAHREWIDIQYLLKGSEKICCLPLEYLKETKVYDAAKDAAFYEEAGVAGQEMLVGNRYFAVFFPQDGHKPGLSVGERETVKKVVVKVKVCGYPSILEAGNDSFYLAYSDFTIKNAEGKTRKSIWFRKVIVKKVIE